MIQIVEVDKICATLESLLSIPFIDGKSYTNRTDNIYVSVATMGETVSNIVSKEALIQFTFIGNQSQTGKDMRDLITTVTNTMIGDECLNLMIYDTFAVHHIAEWSMNWPLYSDKKEIVYIKNFLFRFSRTHV